MIRLKQLESFLSQVDSFENPSIELEQVSTSAEIAARMIYSAANSFEDIENCNVVCIKSDFKCLPIDD